MLVRRLAYVLGGRDPVGMSSRLRKAYVAAKLYDVADVGRGRAIAKRRRPARPGCRRVKPLKSLRSTDEQELVPTEPAHPYRTIQQKLLSS